MGSSTILAGLVFSIVKSHLEHEYISAFTDLVGELHRLQGNPAIVDDTANPGDWH